MLKKLFLLSILLGNLVQSQDFSANWTGYFSYNNITSLSYGDDKIFASAQNAVFSYDILSNETETISTIQGLSGGDISAIYYSEDFDILFVGYESGLIDIVRKNEKVLTVVDIENKTSITPDVKQINHFYEYNGFLYIATGFGISLYNIERLEFDDSYFIGDNGAKLDILQTTILGDYIYAASKSGGIRRALVSAENLIDYYNWTTIDNGSWLGIASIGSNLYAVKANNSLQKFDGTTFQQIASYNSTPLKLYTGKTYLTVTLRSQVFIYSQSGIEVASVNQFADYPGTFNSGITADGNIFMGTDGSGLLISTITSPANALQVLPDGPLRNDAFSIEAVPDQLWVVFGDYSVSLNPYPLKKRGLSHLRNETGWVNIPYDETLNANNMVNITINPENEEQVFVSSYNSGLLEIDEDLPVKIFDETNSGLSDIPVNPTDVRVNGAAFDANGNLWMTNSQVENGLAIKTGEQIKGFSVKSVISDFEAVNGYTQLVIDRQNNVFFGSSNRGLIGFNQSTEQFARLTGNEDGANLPSEDIRALAADKDGTLWIGTTAGLRLLYSPSRVFDDPETTTNSIVILENDIPVELLNDQVIQAIEVDGSNNKWIGTVSNGVFYFSSDGQETLQQFNTKNSPLPSDNVQDITIDSASGKVYFATPRGIVAFDGSAVAPAENLELVRAFPNPVRPQYQGMVTIDGLTARANVKITDITGNLVYEEISEGGSIQWDTTAFGRHKVASGVYLILVTGEDAVETKIAKLMIIR
ncbi:MAG: two-component regulator propeller domain-containing protein [Leeuwenhoekiella sp.]